MSSSPFPQAASTSAPGPLLLEDIAGSDSDMESNCREVHILKPCKMLIQMLSKCVETERALSSKEILTWMDTENPEVKGLFMHSYSDFQTFEIKDALTIMGMQGVVLASFGYLGKGGTQHLRQGMRDRVLKPLGLWLTTTAESIGMVNDLLNVNRLFEWRNKVEEDYIEEFEEPSDVKVEEVEEGEEMIRSESSGIEEIEGWMEKVNWGQWEEEI